MKPALFALLLLAPDAAWADDTPRDYCPARPGLGSPACTIDPGRVSVETSLADWTLEQVWQYVRAHQLPYNRLYDQGYVSIGCAPCTRAVAPGEDQRAGRWWWENPEHKECGLHTHGRTSQT